MTPISLDRFDHVAEVACHPPGKNHRTDRPARRIVQRRPTPTSRRCAGLAVAVDQPLPAAAGKPHQTTTAGIWRGLHLAGERSQTSGPAPREIDFARRLPPALRTLNSFAPPSVCDDDRLHQEIRPVASQRRSTPSAHCWARKPRPVGWFGTTERLDEVGSTWPVARHSNARRFDAMASPASGHRTRQRPSCALLYFPGGGYCSGRLEHRDWWTEAGRAARSPHARDRLSACPEHPYPARHDGRAHRWRYCAGKAMHGRVALSAATRRSWRETREASRSFPVRSKCG